MSLKKSEYSCLSNLVGISESDCGCSKTPEDYNVSTTGFFITQDEAYNHCRFKLGETSCELVKLLSDKKNDAVRQVMTDLGAVTSNKIQSRVDHFDKIGQADAGRNLMPSEIPVTPFIEIITDRRIDEDLNPIAFVEIRGIALMLAPSNGPVNIDLRVIRVSDNVVLKTYTINQTHFTKNHKTVDYLKLPCDGETYRVEYDRNLTAFSVVESEYHCACGDKLKGMAGFIQENVSKSYGISLYCRFACETGVKVCNILSNPDYRLVVAGMIRRKAIELTLQTLYFKQEINRFALLSTEDTEKQIGEYQAQYDNSLKWLSMESNYVVDGFCATCNQTMKKINLLTGR